MQTQYDEIGESYERFKHVMPLARFAEPATFKRVVGDCAGRAVLDLACGTGWYSRVLRRAGADVTGVDISAEMIDVARRIEDAQPLGVRYHCQPAQELPRLGRFDLVSAVWLLCYALTPAELTDLARAAFDNLADGGRYAGIEMNPAFDWHGPPATRYGLTHRAQSTIPHGKRLRVTAHVQPDISFDATFWEAGPILDAFLTAGFRAVEFVAPVIPEAGVAEFGDSFWDDFRTNPPLLGITAVR